jgi:hypothetical protein
MEILCPNCQRKLTISEQHAGQMMKCPLCAGTFTAPALPSAPATPESPIFALAEPPPVLPAPVPPVVVAPSMAPPPPKPPKQAPLPVPSPAPRSSAPADYSGKFTIWLSPLYMQYVPAVALFLVFILTFFTWVGYYPGELTVDTQSAWQAAFGRVTTDLNFETISIVQPKRAEDEVTIRMMPRVVPGFDFLLFMFLLLLFVNLVVAVVAVALNFSMQILPAMLQPYVSWRWPVLALITVVVYGLLQLNDYVGFNLHRRAMEDIDAIARRRDQAATTADEKLEIRRQRGELLRSLEETYWYRSARRLYFLAVLFAALTMLAELRSPRPCPRVDLLY